MARTFHFNPTKRQILRVQEMIERGWTKQKIMKAIVDPGTGRTINEKTLEKCFGHMFEVDYSRGKESFEPEPRHAKIVRMGRLCGLSLEDIAALVINPATGNGITIKTLETHFAQELAIGKNQILMDVTHSLLRNAIRFGDFKAQAFILRSQGKWNDGTSNRQADTPTVRASDAGVLIVPADASDPKEWERASTKAMQEIFALEAK